MLLGKRVAVVVPAYNEAPRIAGVLSTLPAFVDAIVVVDDGSRDATSERAQQAGDARVRVVRHPDNRGVGAAIVTGYHAGFEDTRTDIVAVMAGDGQMAPTELAALLEPIARGTADYVKGNRLSHPDVRARMPWTRWLGNHVLSAMTRVATGLVVDDSQCGFTAIGREAYLRVPWERLWQRYGYPNDLLGWLSERGARIGEVQVTPIYGDEASGVRVRDALLVIPWLLLRVAWRRRPARRPGKPTESACESAF